MNKTQTIRIPLADLQEHKKNTIIYGQEDVRELAETIKNSGWIKTLTISQRTGENVIIAGNSCFKAAKLLNGKEHEGETLDFSELECRVEEFANEWEEIERLVLDNQGRTKTTVQKAQEAKYLEQAQRMAALERKKHREKLPEEEKGRVRDKLAEKVGMGSGRTLEKAMKVKEAIDSLKEEGKNDDAGLLEEVLNRTVDGAMNLLKSAFLENAPEDIKEEVRQGKLSTQKAIDYVSKPEFVLTHELITNFFKTVPYTLAQSMQEAEARQWCRLFGLPFFHFAWNSRENKGAIIRLLQVSPKALILYRTYFYSQTERELLHGNLIEARNIYEMCRWFGIGMFPNNQVQTKEAAAAKLIPFLNDMRYEKISKA